MIYLCLIRGEFVAQGLHHMSQLCMDQFLNLNLNLSQLCMDQFFYDPVHDKVDDQWSMMIKLIC